jgi:hypothetical protein
MRRGTVPAETIPAAMMLSHAAVSLRPSPISCFLLGMLRLSLFARKEEKCAELSLLSRNFNL